MTVFLMTLVKPSSEQNCIVVTILTRVLTFSMTVFMFDNFDESCDNVVIMLTKLLTNFDESQKD